MFFSIDFSNDLAIYDQIIRQIKFAVADGSLKRCNSERSKLIRLRLQQVLSEAKHSGLEADEIFAMVKEEWKALEKKLPSASRTSQ